MAQAVLVINNKGGTGKTTVARQLAYTMRDRGHSVGVLDADIDSANLASRFGATDHVEYQGDHTIKPVEHDGLYIYSMENAFNDASFSQSGEFMREVIENMVFDSDWSQIDYLIVDCPPGSSDVFSELVRSLRPNMLGAISVGQPDAKEDTARLVKVCNHNWIPILGFVENMSGVADEEGIITSDATGEEVYPLGQGDIERFVKELGGNYCGSVPLCTNKELIPELAGETIENAAKAIEDAPDPEMPEDHTKDQSFIKNLWKAVVEGMKQINNELDIAQLQDRFGVEDREPLVMRLELTDAQGIGSVMSEIILTTQDGEIKVVRPSKAKRNGLEVEGGLRISSQELYNALKGEKLVMNSVNGQVQTEPYSIIKAIRMGEATVYGDRTINRLSVLDTLLSEVVPTDKVRKAVLDST